MKTSIQTALDQMQKNFDYLDHLVSVQSDPRYYNALIIPIEKAIKTLKKNVPKLEVEKSNLNRQALTKAKGLQKKYQLLKAKYNANHPWKNLK